MKWINLALLCLPFWASAISLNTFKDTVKQKASSAATAVQSGYQAVKEKIVPNAVANRIPSVKNAPFIDGEMACNGHTQLCDRRYDQVAYPFAHNGSAQSVSPVSNQDLSFKKLLEIGVRATKLPIHYQKDFGDGKGEIPMACHGATRRQINDPNYVQMVEETLNKGIDSIFGAHLTGFVGSLKSGAQKVASGVGSTIGKVQGAFTNRYGTGKQEAKHAFKPCAIDWKAQKFVDICKELKAFLDNHPHEVFTLKLEENIPVDQLGKIIEETGLSDYALQFPGSWPTLRQMIESNKRLVIFSQKRSSAYPWLNPTSMLISTPYSFQTIEQLSFATNPQHIPPNYLFEVQHFITRGLAGNREYARRANSKAVLTARLKALAQGSKHIPNFVEVDFIEKPNMEVFDVVDHLNGVGKYAGKPLVDFGF